MDLNIRPSNLDRVLECPGSARANALMGPQPDNEFTLLGKKRHDGAALMMRIGPRAALEKLAKLLDWTAEDLRVIGAAYESVAHLFTEGMEFFVEYQVNLEFLGITEGERRIDVLGIDRARRMMLVLDWKFGKSDVADPEQNWQIKSYAAGALAEFAKEVDGCELVIAQPLAWKAEDRCREASVTVAYIREEAQKILAGVRAAQQENAPRMPTAKACQWCSFKAACPEKLGAKKQLDAFQAERLEAEVASGAAAVTVIAQEGMDFALPIVVISESLVERVERLVADAEAIEVTDVASANQAGMLSKEIRNLNNDIDKFRKKVKEPWKWATDQIDAAPKPYTTKLAKADELLQSKVQPILQAEARKAAEAEALRVAEERAAAKAEEERLKAERARKVENQAVHAEAAQEAQAQLAVIQEQRAILAPNPAPVLQLTGFKAAPTVSLTVNDIGTVPAEWARRILMVDERRVKELLVKGLLTEEHVKGWGSISRGVAAGRK